MEEQKQDVSRHRRCHGSTVGRSSVKWILFIWFTNTNGYYVDRQVAAEGFASEQQCNEFGRGYKDMAGHEKHWICVEDKK
jgi:hypothetical protein